MSIRVLLVIVLSLFGEVLQAQNNLDSLKKVLSGTKDTEKRAQIYYQLAIEYAKIDLQKSLETALDGLQLAINSENEKLTIDFYAYIGTVYIRIGAYELALQNLYKAQSLAKDNNIIKTVRILSNNIGAVYDRMAQYDKALDIYLKLLHEIENDTKNTKTNISLLPSLYNNIGNIYDIKFDHQKALTFYKKGLVFSKKNKDKRTEGLILKNIGDLYMSLDSLEKADVYLQQALEIRKEEGNTDDVCTNLIKISQLHLYKGEITEAFAYANQAEKLSETLGSFFIKQQLALIYSDLYNEKGDISKAFEYYKEYKVMSDSIFNQRVADEIHRFELEIKFKEREKLSKENQKKRETRLVIIVVTLLVVIVIVLLLYFLQRTLVSKIKLQQQNLSLEKQALELTLETKNKELITNVMYLVSKNELLKDTTERLIQALETVKPENKKTIQQVIIDLQTSVDKDVWEDFELRFNQVHSEFYEKLNQNFDDLTPNEKKLCAFLKLNMTTKEISAITQQSARSIEVARARLRKKLKIANTNLNLVNFLNEL